jgi:exopolyphosphatase/guanosine-5'-triphosphate,3'-diphosphate pyrophosphatase
MVRVEQAVASFVDEMRTLGAARVTAVATSASRDAANGDAFLDRLEAAGVRPEIITGEREAQLTFVGATHGECADGTLVVDIGGGSTELILGAACDDEPERTLIAAARSIDVGARRVTERFLTSDPPTARELDHAAGWVADELRPFFGGLKARPREMVAVAGTATSLAAIDLALDPYDAERVHGYRIGGHALLDILEQLSEMTLEQRRQVPGLEPERAGVIVGGALILQAVLAYAGLASTLVSEHDILYGMVLDPAEPGPTMP